MIFDAFAETIEYIVVTIIIFVGLAFYEQHVNSANNHAEFYLRYVVESRRMTEAFDAGCLDDDCKWWPSWSVMCKRRKK